jgi:hypothetical protein
MARGRARVIDDDSEAEETHTGEAPCVLCVCVHAIVLCRAAPVQRGVTRASNRAEPSSETEPEQAQARLLDQHASEQGSSDEYDNDDGDVLEGGSPEHTPAKRKTRDDQSDEYFS